MFVRRFQIRISSVLVLFSFDTHAYPFFFSIALVAHLHILFKKLCFGNVPVKYTYSPPLSTVFFDLSLSLSECTQRAEVRVEGMALRITAFTLQSDYNESNFYQPSSSLRKLRKAAVESCAKAISSIGMA